MRETLEAQLHAGNLEVNIVGDIKGEELDDLLVKYLGTIEAVLNPPQKAEEAIDVSFPAREVRQQVWHLKDSDERAAAYIAGKACFPKVVRQSIPTTAELTRQEGLKRTRRHASFGRL